MNEFFFNFTHFVKKFNLILNISIILLIKFNTMLYLSDSFCIFLKCTIMQTFLIITPSVADILDSNMRKIKINTFHLLTGTTS